MGLVRNGVGKRTHAKTPTVDRVDEAGEVLMFPATLKDDRSPEVRVET